MSKGVDLSGLDGFTSSSLLTGKKENTEGKLYFASIDLFVEDEENARKTYDLEKLNELKESISVVGSDGKQVGIKQPLSVKKHPSKEGYFLINGGSRRYRAAKELGLKELPYFIDEVADAIDNVVDNLIRDGLKAHEISNFINEQLKNGMKGVEIAKRLGKPKSFVSEYALFNKIPATIRALYDEKRCESVQVLIALHRAHTRFPEAIESYCEDLESSFNIKQVKAFIDSLKTPASTESKPEEDSQDQTNEQTQPVNLEEDQETKTTQQTAEEPTNTDKIKSPIVLILHDEREARVILKKRAAYGLLWIKYEDNGEELQINATEAKIIAVLEK
jgi:ParB family chromosome partitioning protein